MWSARYILKNQAKFIKHNIRSRSFKLLDGALNFDESAIEVAKSRSQAACTALEKLINKAKNAGSSKAVHRHTVVNKKLLVRKRLELLLDQESPFLEIGALAGFSMDYGDVPSAASVAGIGKIQNRYCLVVANDATIKGGTLFPISVTKQIRIQTLSLLNHLPCIYLVDSGGAFLPLQADIFPDRDHGGRTFYNEAVLTSKGIPQLAVVCGSCTAGGAYCPMMSEDVVIVKNIGVIFLGGPPLVKAATGEVVTEQDLGGADMHCSVSGCTDSYAETEEEAYDLCRDSVLALNIPPIQPRTEFEEPVYPTDELNLISGKTNLTRHDIYKVLARIVDGSAFKEFKPKFGTYLVTGFASIYGRMVGVLFNCGNLTWQDAQKGSHFIQLCEARNIPMVFLQNSGDSPNDNESCGLALRERAKMVSAHSTSNVPKISINIGSCFGDENYTMCGASFQPNFVFSWPLAHISSEWVPTDKRLSIEDFNMIDKSHDQLFYNSFSAFHHASKMSLDAVIQPGDTRKVLSFCLDIVSSKTSHCNAKHNERQSIIRM